MTDLQRRYRRLLHAYPKSYRHQRGDELLGTLLDLSDPGQRWPAPREARALLLGGLRMRTGADRLPAPAHAWLDSARAALVLMLTTQIIIQIWNLELTRGDLPTGEPLGRRLTLPAAATVLLAAGSITALLAARPRLGIALAFLTPLPGLHLPADTLYLFQIACWWLPVTALAVPLLRLPAPDRRWRSQLTLPVLVLASTLLPLTGQFLAALIAALVTLTACLAWAAVIDPRPGLALGLLLLTITPLLLASASMPTLNIPLVLILGTTLTSTGALRARRLHPA